jgi:hypothetical protein
MRLVAEQVGAVLTRANITERVAEEVEKELEIEIGEGSYFALQDALGDAVADVLARFDFTPGAAEET